MNDKTAKFNNYEFSKNIVNILDGRFLHTEIIISQQYIHINGNFSF